MSKEKIISVRLYEEMLEALDTYASKERKGRTQIIREAITNYLDLPKEAIEEKIDTIEEKINTIEEKIGTIEEKGETFEKELQVVLEKLDKETKKNTLLEEEVRELKSLVYQFLKKI